MYSSIYLTVRLIGWIVAVIHITMTGILTISQHTHTHTHAHMHTLECTHTHIYAHMYVYPHGLHILTQASD